MLDAFAITLGDTRYELRYTNLFDRGRGYAFPCDALGHVDLDQLSDRGRNNYLYARAVVGMELSLPGVSPVCRARAPPPSSVPGRLL